MSRIRAIFFWVLLLLSPGAFSKDAQPFQIQFSCPAMKMAILNSQFSVNGMVQISGVVNFRQDGSFWIVPEGSTIENLTIRAGKITLTDINFHGGKDSFSFVVKRIKSDSGTWDDLSMVLSFVPEGVRMSSIRCPSLGDGFESEGMVTADPGRVGMSLSSKGISLRDILKSLSKNENVFAEGLYEGEARLAVSQSGVTLSADFHNTSPGVIKVQGDISSLKGNLSQDYYRLLVENFKNYQYNKGVIGVKSRQRDVSVQGVFESEQGMREIEILLHNILP